MPPNLGAARGKFAVLYNNWGSEVDPYVGAYGDYTDPGAMTQDSYDTGNLEGLWAQAAVQLPNANAFIQNGTAISSNKFALTPLDASRVQDITQYYFSAPYWMASGNGLRVVVDYPTSVSEAFDFLAGTRDLLAVKTRNTGNGMNARTKTVLDAQCSVFRSGIVSMDFAPSDLVRTIYAHNSFSTTAPVPTLARIALSRGRSIGLVR
jgi:hypothetical protein